MATAPAPGPPRRENPARHLVLPALLTLPALLLAANAWASGDADLLDTALFWVGLMWGGVVLFFAGGWHDAFLRARAA